MRARLYLCGDGNARRTHVSLFFVLMRSDYDAILKFPFHYKVTFCLYDQSGEGKHIIGSFRPDIRSSSFQRPRSDTNIPSGIRKFVRLEVLKPQDNSYVRDDTVFIKVIVDFANFSKKLLLFACSLNPALPGPIQHLMIEREKQKEEEQRLAEKARVDRMICC